MFEEKHQRQAELDAMRAIAALLVILVHYLAAFFPYALFGPQDDYLPQANWETLFTFPPLGAVVAGHAAVCLFFILSGYVLSLGFVGRRAPLTDMLVACCKRPIRLGGVVLFTGLVGGLLWGNALFFNVQAEALMASNAWLLMYWPGELSASFPFEFLKAPFSSGVMYNPPLWTIRYELYGSLLIFGLLWLASGWRHRWLVWLGALIVFREDLYQGFILGLIAADLARNGPVISDRLKRRLCIGGWLVGLYLTSRPHYYRREDLEGTFYSWLPELNFLGGEYAMLGATLLFMSLLWSRGLRSYLSASPVLQYLGRISYALYAVHFLVMGSVSCWLYVQLNGALGHQTSFLVVLLTGLPLILIFAHVATMTIDRLAIGLAGTVGLHVSVHLSHYRDRLLRNDRIGGLAATLNRYTRQ